MKGLATFLITDILEYQHLDNVVPAQDYRKRKGPEVRHLNRYDADFRAMSACPEN